MIAPNDDRLSVFPVMLRAENSTLKQIAFVLAIIHSVLHLFIGPFELIIIVIMLISGGFSMISLFLLFLLAAVSKLATLALTIFTTNTTQEKFSDKTYFWTFTGAVFLNTGCWIFVTYGNITYIRDTMLVFLHIYTMNYVLLVLVALAASLYILSRGDEYMLLRRPRKEFYYMPQQQQVPVQPYYYP